MRRALLRWYRSSGRDLPFRRTTDPYAILVSEIMLQQTQVDRVVPKWNAWIKRFPDWRSLASAPRAEVLRYWSGLGYNSRAVRLQTLAKIVVEEHDCQLPETEEELIALPGIGPYTAGAIMVFAHNKPGMCIDVNIERVFKRVHFRKRERAVRERLEQELFILLGRRARDVGNALMDLGSAICTPTDPRCAECPLHALCKSRGERPDEQGVRVAKRQKPFLHSNRWWRGQILRRLAHKQMSRLRLEKEIEQKKTGQENGFSDALKELQEEKLVSCGRTLKIEEPES